METLIIYKLGFNQNYQTSVLILLINIALCSKFHRTKFINLKSSLMELEPLLASRCHCFYERQAVGFQQQAGPLSPRATIT